MHPTTFSTECALVRAETSIAFTALNNRGFEVVAQTGFYPRVRAERTDIRTLGIDFWMSLDADGKYRTACSRDVPFELGGSTTVTRREEDGLVRYWKSYVLYADRPYDVALQTLGAVLVAVAEVIVTWSEEAILSTGKRVPIRQGPRA